jgi:hypothetical protein
MEDVKAVIEQATDAMGTPPEARAKAPKPKLKKVGQAAKKVVMKVGPKKVSKKEEVSQEIYKESIQEGESQEKEVLLSSLGSVVVGCSES